MKAITILVAALGCAVSMAAPSPPVVAGTWDADYYFWSPNAPAAFGGHMTMDIPNNKQLMVQFHDFGVMEIIAWYNTKTMWVTSNGGCKKQAAPAGAQANWFGWLPAATYAGQQSLNGTTCDVWTFKTGSTSLDAWFDAADPVFPLAYNVNDGTDDIHYRFWNWVFRAEPSSLFVPPASICGKTSLRGLSSVSTESVAPAGAVMAANPVSA